MAAARVKMAAIGKKTGDTKAAGAFYGRVAWFINTRRSTEGAYPCKSGRSTGAESAPGESANLLPSY